MCSLRVQELESRDCPSSVVGGVPGLEPWVYVDSQPRFLAFPREFRGGVNVTYTESVIYVGAGPGACPQVTAYRYDGSILWSSFAFPQEFRGGCDVQLSKYGTLLIGAGPSGLPQITETDLQGKQLGAFFARDALDQSGVSASELRYWASRPFRSWQEASDYFVRLGIDVGPNISLESLRAIPSELATLGGLYETLRSKGWRLLLRDDAGAGLAGFTTADSAGAYSVVRPQLARQALLHEAGHAVDVLLGPFPGYSFGTDWRRLADPAQNYAEQWAEAFAAYYRGTLSGPQQEYFEWQTRSFS